MVGAAVMAIVVTVLVTVVVVAVVNVLVETEVVLTLVLAVVALEVAAVIDETEITLEFAAVTVSCSAYVESDGAVDLLAMYALAGVLTVAVIGGPVCIGVDTLVAVNVNMFAGVMTEVKFVMPEALTGLSC